MSRRSWENIKKCFLTVRSKAGEQHFRGGRLCGLLFEMFRARMAKSTLLVSIMC